MWSPPTKGKALNKPQRGKLAKLADKLEKIQEEWNDLEKHREDAFLWDLLPKPLLTSAQQAMVEVGACLAEVQVVLTDGWEGNPHCVLDRVAAAYEKGLQNNEGVANMFKIAAGLQGEAK